MSPARSTPSPAGPTEPSATTNGQPPSAATAAPHSSKPSPQSVISPPSPAPTASPRHSTGYQALIDYWARTGGWIQQWTTLRNLARLLHTIGDHEAAVYLDAAANHAPDAPPIPEHPNEPNTTNLPADQMETIITNAATASRDDVIAVAHRALNHHRRPQPPSSPL